MVWIVVVSVLAAAPAGDGDLRKPLAAIRAVGPNGKGAREAAAAWRELGKTDVRHLPEILAGMDGANDLARNWLRSAVDQVLERAREEGKSLPATDLESFLRDTKHDPQARRLAYDLLLDKDQTLANRLLPGMLDDPSPELRRDAVARVLREAEGLLKANQKKDALPQFEKALAAARDKEQIDQAVRHLRGLGRKIDVPTHLGLVMDWKLIGPFPNDKRSGVDKAYPPEQQIDLTAVYDGKAGKVRWKAYTAKDEAGTVDVNAGVGAHTEAVAYALTEFTSRDEKPVEIRMACYTPFKMWLNGQLVLERGEAYTGMDFDHNVAKVRLKPGKNQILLKVIQDDPPPQVPKLWQFLLRVCDANGVAVLSTTRPAPPEQPFRSP